jgi:DNA-binding NarL/FixJ family response regulator
MASISQLLVAPKLEGQRVLIVQCQPPQAFSLGATVARAGAHVTVARTRGAAMAEIERRDKGYDAAVVDADLPGDGIAAVVHALRGVERPCLAVGLCSSVSQADRQRAVAAGVIDLFLPPHRPDTFVDALHHCAMATAHLRAKLGNGVAPLEPPPIPLLRRPPHAVGSGPRRLVDPARQRRSDLEGRVIALASGRGLSDRELCVLRYIAMGYRYDEIAAVMVISPRTVKMHAFNVRKKVGASDRYHLLRKMYAL